jgi:general secretion pathway protein D
MTTYPPHLPLTAVLALALMLTGCASKEPVPEPVEPGQTTRSTPYKSTQGMSPAMADAAQRALEPGLPTEAEKAKIFKGTGVLVKGQQPGGGVPPAPAVQPVPGGGVVLNFEGADIREVIRNILGDILNVSYSIEGTVGGTVTLRTSSGIPRDALPATLEMLLRANGAAMIKEEGIYKIVPAANVVRGNVTPQLGNSQRALPPGFSVQVVPLRYVGVREMVRILEPFAKDATAVRPDDLRNLVILSGTENELRHLLDTIAMFDVNWMEGMSVGLFTLQNADVKVVGQELDKVIGDKATSPLAGILRIIPIERLNALLVITPQPAYLDEAKKWIARLDAGGGGDGPRLFVYSMQSQRAEKLGPLLTQAFTGRVQQQTATPAPSLAPGTTQGTIVSPPGFIAQSTTPGQQPLQVVTTNANPPPATTGTAAGGAARAGAAAGEGLGIIRNIQVVADKDNNQLLIVATPPEYAVIETALKKLDVPSRQVAIEVTIASVSLNDSLTFGIDWLFKGGAPSGQGSGGNFNRVITPLNPAVPLAAAAAAAANPALALVQGFYYIINNSNFPGGVQAALHLLDQYGDTKVLANPHLAALDNQKATIKAGTQIPINQQSVVGGTSNVVTTAASYIDTGVLLQVTPHINVGGLVGLEVNAEVSVPGTPTNPGDAPPIDTRSVQTSVGVQSGQTMVMGGLIQETKANTSNGLPLISRIPVLGGLFGTQELKNNRNELIFFITPRVVETELDLRSVIEDLRKRMEKVDDTFDVFTRATSNPALLGPVPPKPAPPASNVPFSPPTPLPQNDSATQGK